MAIKGITSWLKTKVWWVWKIQEISFPMSTKTSQFCKKKTAEKNEFKHAYTPWKNDIMCGYPVDLSFACNSMIDEHENIDW